jgi:hypothetical protein
MGRKEDCVVDGHLDARAAHDQVAAYAGLLRTRKRQALIGIIALATCTVVSFAVLGSMALTLMDKAMTRLNTLVAIVVLVFPYLGLVQQAAEYRRLGGLLELIDVLERAERMDAMSSRDQ